MLRHSTGYARANDGRTARDIQAYLGHRNIRHVVRYTELSPARFVVGGGRSDAGGVGNPDICHGDIVQWLRFNSAIIELFYVDTIPNSRCATAIEPESGYSGCCYTSKISVIWRRARLSQGACYVGDSEFARRKTSKQLAR